MKLREVGQSGSGENGNAERTRHTLTGTLRWTGREFALEIDDGGVWRLDVGAKANRSIGHRVTVEGVRTGFDLLDVNRLNR